MLEIGTSASCNKCGKWVNYDKGKFVCPHCGNSMRVSPEDVQFNLADLYELNIPYTSVKYDNRLEKLCQLCDKYDIDFFGFDLFDKMKGGGYSGMLDIGWEDGWPDNLSEVVKELKRILR